MNYCTPYCPRSYANLPDSPVELEKDEWLDHEQLKALAVADDYEKYADLLPFSEWDYLEGEEPSDTWLSAVADLAEADDYSLYDGETEAGSLVVEMAAIAQAENAQRCTVREAA